MANFFLVQDREKDYQSYMVYVLALIWSVITAVVLSLGFYYFPHLWMRWLILICIALFISVFNLTLNRFGYVRLASWSLTIMLWLFITIPCYTAGGIMGPGIIAQMSIILTAGFLLGWKGGLAIGLLTMGADYWFVYLEINGQLPYPSVIHTPITRWVSAIIPFGTILILQYYATNHLRSSLISLQREKLKREEASENLRASEERYKSIIAVSNTGAWEYNLDTNKVWYSDQYYGMIGLDLPSGGWDDMMFELWVERLHPEDREATIKHFEDYLKSGSTGLYENYFRVRHENGEYIWIWSRARRLLDKDGNLTNIALGTHIDISERKKAEEEIKQSEQFLKKVTSQVPGNTYVFEIEESGFTPIIFINRGTVAFNYKYDSQDLISDPDKIREALYEDDKIKFNDAMKEAYLTQGKISFQYRMVVNDSIRWRWMQAVPEKAANGKIIWYGATSDITPLVDYIASIEQILFDISHVMRRPIATMKGMTRLIMDHELSEQEIKEVSEKLHAITEEMDKFSLELNRVYNEKRQNREFNIDLSSLIDKRSSLFN